MKYMQFVLIIMISGLMIAMSSIRVSSYSLRKTIVDQRAEVFEKHKTWQRNFINEVLNNSARERFYYNDVYSASYKVKNITQLVETRTIDFVNYDSPYNIYVDTLLIMTDTKPYLADNTNFTYNSTLRSEVTLNKSSISYDSNKYQLFSSTENIYKLEQISDGHVFEEGTLNYVMIKDLEKEEYAMFNYAYSQIPEEFSTIEIEGLATITRIKTMTGYYYIYNVENKFTLINKLFSHYTLNNKELDGITIELESNDVLMIDVDPEMLIIDTLVNKDIVIETTLMVNSKVVETTNETVVVDGYNL